MGYKLTGMYIGQQKIRPSRWQPGANTIAYYPLTSTTTVNDQSGNGYNLTIKGNATFGTYGGVDCCYINVGQLATSSISSISSSSSYTLNIWYNEASAPNNDNGVMFALSNQTPSSYSHFSGIVRNNGWHGYGSGYGVVGIIDWDSTTNATTSPTYSISAGNWTNIVYIYTPSSISIYINGVLYSSGNISGTAPSVSYIVLSRDSNLDRSIKGYVSKAIVEDKVRTSQEIADYYDLTKGDYGIS